MVPGENSVRGVGGSVNGVQLERSRVKSFGSDEGIPRDLNSDTTFTLKFNTRLFPDTQAWVFYQRYRSRPSSPPPSSKNIDKDPLERFVTNGVDPMPSENEDPG